MIDLSFLDEETLILMMDELSNGIPFTSTECHRLNGCTTWSVIVALGTPFIKVTHTLDGERMLSDECLSKMYTELLP